MDMRHGGPYDRGAADRYYGRKFDPHCFLGETYTSKRIDLKPEDKEYAEYRKGWNECEDRKEWS